MNPEVKAEWTSRLRSGEYRQGVGHLRQDLGWDTPDGSHFSDIHHCCLGVLCETLVDKFPHLIPEGIRVKIERDGIRVIDRSYQFATWWMLSPRLANAVGLKDGVGSIPDGMGTHLAGLNDNGSSFSEIADMIDRYL